MRGEGGFALVITLLITALLLALSAEFINEVYVDTSLSRSFVAGQQASLLANSGIEGGVALLKMALPGQNYRSLSDPWAKPLHWDDERGGVTVTIEDESGRLNLNKLVPPGGKLDPNNFYYLSTVSLIQKLQLPAGLGDALVDWLDGDDTQQQNGAESSYYGKLRSPYQAKNDQLDTVEEVGLIKGFKEQGGGVLQRLKPFVTIYSDGTVNINTASKEVLASLQTPTVKMTDDLAERVIEQRKISPFKSTGELAGRVSGMESMGQGLQGLVAVNSPVYRIRSEAQVGETRRVVEAVVRMDASFKAATTLYWREY